MQTIKLMVLNFIILSTPLWGQAQMVQNLVQGAQNMVSKLPPQMRGGAERMVQGAHNAMKPRELMTAEELFNSSGPYPLPRLVDDIVRILQNAYKVKTVKAVAGDEKAAEGGQETKKDPKTHEEVSMDLQDRNNLRKMIKAIQAEDFKTFKEAYDMREQRRKQFYGDTPPPWVREAAKASRIWGALALADAVESIKVSRWVHLLSSHEYKTLMRAILSIDAIVDQGVITKDQAQFFAEQGKTIFRLWVRTDRSAGALVTAFKTFFQNQGLLSKAHPALYHALREVVVDEYSLASQLLGMPPAEYQKMRGEKQLSSQIPGQSGPMAGAVPRPPFPPQGRQFGPPPVGPPGPFPPQGGPRPPFPPQGPPLPPQGGPLPPLPPQGFPPQGPPQQFGPPPALPIN